MASTFNLDNATEVPSNLDAFEEALQIVLSAREASDQAVKANKQAKEVDKLSRKLHAKAESLSRVATNLAFTAAEAASKALRICGYASYEMAYEARPAYVETLPMSDLFNVLNITEDDEQEFYVNRDNKTPISPSASAWLNDMDKDSKAREKPLKTPLTHAPVYLYDGDDVLLKRHTVHNFEIDGKHASPKSNKDTTKHHSTIESKFGPLSTALPSVKVPQSSSFRPIKSDDTSALSVSERTSKSDVGKKLSDSSMTRYVHPGTASFDRQMMKASFDNLSAQSTSPLWEDRYVDNDGQVHVHSVYTPEKWSEKKAMRQFQIKLGSLNLDSDDKKDLDNSGKRSAATATASASDSASFASADIKPPKPRQLNKVRDCDSSDSEVEELLKPRQQWDSEKLHPSTQRLHHEVSEKRSISPLLSSSEQICYSVEDRSPVTSPLPHTKPKHIYKPDTSHESQ